MNEFTNTSDGTVKITVIEPIILSNQQHYFNTGYAQMFGIETAIILQNILYWIQKNKANKTNIYDNEVWTYNSVRAFKELFPYMSETMIWRSLKKLEEKKIIKKGNFNKSGYDKTGWYSIDVNDYTRNLFQNELWMFQNETPIFQNETPIFQNEITIPDINTDNKPYININNNSLPNGKGSSKKPKQLYCEKIKKTNDDGSPLPESEWTELTLTEMIETYKTYLMIQTGIEHRVPYTDIAAFNKQMINYLKSLNDSVTSWDAVRVLVECIQLRHKEMKSTWTPDHKTIGYIVKNADKYYPEYLRV